MRGGLLARGRRLFLPPLLFLSAEAAFAILWIFQGITGHPYVVPLEFVWGLEGFSGWVAE